MMCPKITRSRSGPVSTQGALCKGVLLARPVAGEGEWGLA